MSKSHLFSQLFIEYCRDNPDLSKRYLRDCKRHIKKLCEYQDNITAVDGNEYREFLKDRYKSTSINTIINHSRPFFSWLVNKQVIKSNPFDGLKPLRTRRAATFSGNDVKLLLDAASPLWRLRIMLGLCGMSTGEILNLCRTDAIDIKDKTIIIYPKKDTDHTWPWSFAGQYNKFFTFYEGFEIKNKTYNLHGLFRDVTADIPDEQPYLFITPETYKHILTLKGKGMSHIRHLCPDPHFSPGFDQLLIAAGIKKRQFSDLRYSAGIKKLETIETEIDPDAPWYLH